MRVLLFLSVLVVCALSQDFGAPAQCPIFRFTSNVVSDNAGGWSVQFNPQTSKTLDFVIVHYRSNQNGDWINQRMTSISNSEWTWPLDIDLFTGETLQYWFTYCAERVDCDSPQFAFTVPQPTPEPTTEPTTAPEPTQQYQQMAPTVAPVNLAPAFVDSGHGGRYGKGGKGRGYGHGGYDDVAAAAIPYTVGPAVVYQSSPVAYPEYSQGYGGGYGGGAAPIVQSGYGGGGAPLSAPLAQGYAGGASAPLDQGYAGGAALAQAPLDQGYGGGGGAPFAQDAFGAATIIPSATFANDGHGGKRGYGHRGGYPIIGSQPIFSAAGYGGGAGAPLGAPLAQGAYGGAPLAQGGYGGR